MRPELNQIEKIEKFLNGTLNTTDRANFEAEMLVDNKLKEQVVAQKLVQQAALRKAIRADVLQYGVGASGGWASGWSSLKWFSILGGGLAILALLLGSYFLMTNESSEKIVANYERISSVLDNNSVQNQSDSEKSEADNSSDLTKEKETKIEKESQDEYPSNTNKNIGRSAFSSSSKKSNQNQSSRGNKTPTNTNTTIGRLKTWATPELQYFEVFPDQGAMLTCKDGTLIVVPDNAFVDGNGNTLKTKVTVEVVEALTMAEMVGYNLVTMNDDKPLSSGGMIYIQPKSQGKNVNINPDKPLYIEIPTEEYNPKMMAWESEIDDQGDINWKNPKPLEKYLTKIDFANLDFLPEGFAQAVAVGMPYKHYTEATDELVDSLYYNFGLIPVVTDSYDQEFKQPKTRVYLRDKKPKRYFGINSIHGRVVDKRGKPMKDITVDVVRMGQNIKKSKLTNRKGKFKFRMVTPGTGMVLADKKDTSGRSTNEFKAASISIPTYYRLGLHQEEVIVLKNRKDTVNDVEINPEISLRGSFSSNTNERICFINPQSIQTIQSEKFANTFLATKEFEQRIKALHLMPNANTLFDLYVNNLNKNLWEVDQMVADRLESHDKKTFQDFAAQKLTNVKNDCIYQKQLTEYYNREKAKYIDEVRARQAKYASQTTAQLIVEQKRLQNIISEYNKLGNSDPINSAEMVKQNTVTSIRSGYQAVPSTTRLPNLPRPSYSPNVINSANTYSTTWFKSGWMNIDSYLHALGKNPKEVAINCESKKGSKTKIYQCLNTLKAVIPLAIVNQLAKAKFPKKNTKEGRLMRNTYCVGLREHQGLTELAYQKYNPYSTNRIDFTWEKVDPKDLIKKLKLLPGFNKNIIRDIKEEEKVIKNQIKQLEISREIKRKQKELTNKMAAQQEIISKLDKEIELENVFMKTLRKVVDKCNDYKVNTIVTPAMDYPTLNNNVSDIFSVNEVEKQPYFLECKNEDDPTEQIDCTSKKMRSYIEDNITIPQSVIDANVRGKIWVSFVVDYSGEVTGSSLIKGLHPDMDQEVLRVVTTLPKMIPAVQKNKNVSVRYQIPVTINIQ